MNLVLKLAEDMVSLVRVSKETKNGKIGTVVPMHKELKIGTLRGILKLGKISVEEFSKHL